MLCGVKFSLRIAQAFAENDAQHQTRPTGRHVHDRAAGKIKAVNLRVGIPAAIHQAVDAPDHVALREINNQHPQCHEHEDGLELHAFRNRTDDERRGDDGEHHLEHGINVFRNPIRIIRVRRGSDVWKHPADFRIADDALNPVLGHVAGAAEDHAVTANDVEDGYQAGDQETLGKHGEHVLFANETAVEQRQTGQGHE